MTVTETVRNQGTIRQRQNGVLPKFCETPFANGTKPIGKQRTPEVLKRHIKRDGKK